MKIKNFNQLAVSHQRRQVLEIAEAGLTAIDTAKVLSDWVRIEKDFLYLGRESYFLPEIKRLVVVGVGKCSLEAAAVLEKILGSYLSGGVVIDIRPESFSLRKIKYFKGTHPLPSSENVAATREIINLISGLEQKDLVIFIISGGGSTLLSYPPDSSLEREVFIFQQLTKAGASIQEINTVRKHLSLARGGFLAKYAYPAKGVALIFSDVPGDQLSFIASGPTQKDETTVKEAKEILAKYNLFNQSHSPDFGLVETPKEEKYFENIKNMVVVANITALRAMQAKARALNFQAKIGNGYLKGEAREMGIKIAKELHLLPKGTALLYGGETTVTLRGGGRGGRNLELALAALLEIKEDELILPFASDGRDNGELAGAICDIITKRDVERKGLKLDEVLKENNSYFLFEKVGHYLFTGPTGSNVADLLVAVKF